MKSAYSHSLYNLRKREAASTDIVRKKNMDSILLRVIMPLSRVDKEFADEARKIG